MSDLPRSSLSSLRVNSGASASGGTRAPSRDHSGASEVSSIAGKTSASKLMKEMELRADHTQIKDNSSHRKRPLASEEEEEDDDNEDAAARNKKAKNSPNYDSPALSADVRSSAHRPLSRDTRALYETMFTLLKQEMGDKSVEHAAGSALIARRRCWLTCLTPFVPLLLCQASP